MKKNGIFFISLIILIPLIFPLAINAANVPSLEPTAAPTHWNPASTLQSETTPEAKNQNKNVIIKTHAEKIAQLVGDFDKDDQQSTLNLTGQRYQIERTDLGIPFEHKGRIYILFGDAWFPPDDPIAYTTDIDPEDGLELTFLEKNGKYLPIQIPGINLEEFEVPTEGVSINDRMYIYVTTDHSTDSIMGRSVVAFSEDDGHSFTYLYDLSTEHFINVSIVKTELSPSFEDPDQTQGLAIFGSGTYRKSNVHLAFQPQSQIEDPQAIKYFSGMDENDQPIWSTSEKDAESLFDQPCIGELSVSYNPFIQKWLMLYNCDSEEFRGINIRTANQPWGPWSDPLILFHPWEHNGYCNFIHVNWEFRKCDHVYDLGRENEWGGEYGPYQFETLATGTANETTIYFTLSTWNPYTVVLMKATLQVE